MEEGRGRMIKLHCPSLAKTVPVLAREEQRLDLGSISRSFGLDPCTLKINGHFISRGIDLISSSVTWRSLLSFFSAKGLSTGVDDRNVLIVDGKLLKYGNKRRHDEALESSSSPKEGSCRRRHLDDVKITELNKLKEDLRNRQGSSDGLKRKPFMEDSRLMKKLKLLEIAPVEEDRCSKKTVSSKFKFLPFSCGSINDRLKRRRDDEPIEAAPCKRIR